VSDVDLRLLRYFVAVAEERHVGRAAARLNMTQPPLSRAVRQLEDELGLVLLERTPRGVDVTAAGAALHVEARSLLAQAERMTARVTRAGGTPTVAVGTCADTAEQVGDGIVAAFRSRHPHGDVTIRETDLGDPTAGLGADLVDVALTRTPFEATDIRTHLLRSDPIGVVMHCDDPLARRASVSRLDLADRRWIRLPTGSDPIWCSYWTGGAPDPDITGRPVARTIQECLQSVLWGGASALAPLNQVLPKGLVAVPVTDREPSRLVVAWKGTSPNPLVRSFVQIAAACAP